MKKITFLLYIIAMVVLGVLGSYIGTYLYKVKRIVIFANYNISYYNVFTILMISSTVISLLISFKVTIVEKSVSS